VIRRRVDQNAVYYDMRSAGDRVENAAFFVSRQRCPRAKC
jgi:hypothetical protein